MNGYASAADLDIKPVKGGEAVLARIIPSGAFIAGFVLPDYLIDGIVQRRFVYSFTAKTGVGKTALALFIAARVAPGKPIG